MSDDTQHPDTTGLSGDQQSLIRASPESIEGARVIEYLEAIRERVAVEMNATTSLEMMLLAVACANFCGQQFGAMVVIDDQAPDSSSLFAEAMAANIAAGITVGMNKAHRLLQELGGPAVQ